jgi:hypothetical protein
MFYLAVGKFVYMIDLKVVYADPVWRRLLAVAIEYHEVGTMGERAREGFRKNSWVRYADPQSSGSFPRAGAQAVTI